MLDKLCYSVDEVCEMTGFGRRRVLDDIKYNRLRARRRGRRYFILAEDLKAYLEGFPVVGPDDAADETGGDA
jgi:excisionase family DNA binding protein